MQKAIPCDNMLKKGVIRQFGISRLILVFDKGTKEIEIGDIAIGEVKIKEIDQDGNITIEIRPTPLFSSFDMVNLLEKADHIRIEAEGIIEIEEVKL